MGILTQTVLGLVLCTCIAYAAAVNTTHESEQRLQGMIALIEKAAETGHLPLESKNNTEHHKAVNAVFNQWADFVKAVKSTTAAPSLSKLRSIGGPQSRLNDGGNNNYNGNNNNNNANNDQSIRQNHYYKGQGYYSMGGSAGAGLNYGKKKMTEGTTELVELTSEVPTTEAPVDKPLF